MKKPTLKKWTILVSSDATKRVVQLTIPKLSIMIITIILCSMVILLWLLTNWLQTANDTTDQLVTKLEDSQTNLENAERDIKFYQEKANYLDEQMVMLTELQQELASMVATIDPTSIGEEKKTAGPVGGLEFEMEPTNDYTLAIESDLQLSKKEALTNTYDRLSLSIPFLIDTYEETIDNFSDVRKRLLYTPTHWPAETERITSEFGERSDPFTYTSAFHSGIDLAGPYGTPIYATAAGEVITAGRDGGYGNAIVIKHTKDLQTRYAHMSTISVEPGDKVEKGETIGYMGSTGRSTGVHLHYEIIQNGKTIDPFPYMTFMDRVRERLENSSNEKNN